MKICSICKRQYADSLKFCLEDGTVLSPAPAPEVTLVDPQATLRISARETESAVVPAAPKRRSAIIWVALGAVGLLIVIGVAAIVLVSQFGSAGTSTTSETRSTPTPAATPSESTASVQQEVERINSQVGNLMVQGDPDALGRLLADDYRYVSDVGLTLNKMEVLILIRTGNLSYDYLTTTDPKVDVNKELTKAELTGRAAGKGQMRHQPFTDSYFYRNTYEKRDGRWQLVSGTVWHRQ